MTAKRMSKAETIALIKDMYWQFPPSTIAEMCGRSIGCVRNLASALGVQSVGRGQQHAPVFDAREVAILKAEFGRTKLVLLAKRLGRTPEALATKCSRLGLKRARSRLWTPEEDRMIRERYFTEGSGIAGDLDRTTFAVRHRARALGVRFDRSQHPWHQEITDHWEDKKAKRRHNLSGSR